GGPYGASCCALRRADRRRRNVTSQTTNAAATPKNARPSPPSSVAAEPNTDWCGPTANRASGVCASQATRYFPAGTSPGLRNTTYQFSSSTPMDSLPLTGARATVSPSLSVTSQRPPTPVWSMKIVSPASSSCTCSGSPEDGTVAVGFGKLAAPSPMSVPAPAIVRIPTTAATTYQIRDGRMVAPGGG